MRIYITLFILTFYSCKNESKPIPSKLVIEANSKEIDDKNLSKEINREPNYNETADWILEKMRINAKTYESSLTNYLVEENYEKVTISYKKIDISFGKIIIVERLRYSGGKSAEENNYRGYLIREKMMEAPINDIERFEIVKTKHQCYLNIKLNKTSAKHISGIHTIDDIDKNSAMPITEYTKGSGLKVTCNIKPDLEDRLNKALKRLKELNIDKYPDKEQPF